MSKQISIRIKRVGVGSSRRYTISGISNAYKIEANKIDYRLKDELTELEIDILMKNENYKISVS
jgi:hypothetical protein